MVNVVVLLEDCLPEAGGIQGLGVAEDVSHHMSVLPSGAVRRVSWRPVVEWRRLCSSVLSSCAAAIAT